MRFSTLLSFVLALILAGIAVYGAQTWLAQERQQLANSINEQVQLDQAVDDTRTIVVAAEPIGFGERMVPSKVREIPWASPVLPEGSYAKVEDLILGDAEDVARFALTSMAVGEPILAGKVTEPGQRAKMSTALTPGMKAISIRVNDVLGVAGFVLPGDRVDILLTRGGRGGNAFVDVLLQGVKVLAIDQIADDRKDQPSVVRSVTFEVDTAQAQKLVLAANVGTMSLALRNVASTDVQDFERITINDLTDLDAAQDVLAANQPNQDGNAASQEEQDRLVNLETLLKNLSDGLSERMDGVEQKIQKEPVIVEKEVIVEKVVPAPVIIPKNSTIGVIRNGQRNEYKVKKNEDGELVLVTSDETSDEEEAVATE